MAKTATSKKQTAAAAVVKAAEEPVKAAAISRKRGRPSRENAAEYAAAILNQVQPEPISKNYVFSDSLEEYHLWLENFSNESPRSKKAREGTVKTVLNHIGETQIAKACLDKQTQILAFLGPEGGPEGKPYALTTRKTMLQNWEYMLKHFPPALQLPNSSGRIDEFKHIITTLGFEYAEVKEISNRTDIVYSLETLKDAITNKYSLNTENRIIADFYLFWGMRDNLVNVKLISSMEQSDKQYNCLVVPPGGGFENNPVWFILNVNKTVKNYHSQTEQLPPALAEQIRRFIDLKQRRKHIPSLYFKDCKIYFFGETPLSAKVTNIFREAGFNVGISDIRSSHAMDAKTKGPEERARIAKLMGHSAGVIGVSYSGVLDTDIANRAAVATVAPNSAWSREIITNIVEGVIDGLHRKKIE